MCSQIGFNGPEHMALTWESLRGCSTFLTKGEKIKAARWFQFNRRTRDVLSTASSLLHDDDAAAGDDENEEGGRRPEGSPGSDRAVGGCAEPPRGVQLSDGDIEQPRASKNNALAHVADIPSCSAMIVDIVDVSLPLEVEAGKTVMADFGQTDFGQTDFGQF